MEGAQPYAAEGGPAASDDLGSTLFQEAQAEIASLRSELYTTRRREWEAREALTKASHERDDALQTLSDMEQKVQTLQGAASRATQLKQQFQELEMDKSVVDLEVQELRQKLDECQRSLSTEQVQRRKVEELRARAEGERSRLQRERDDAQKQLRIASRRAEDAEAEQMAAEDEAAQARAELEAYSQQQTPGRSEFPSSGQQDEEHLRALEAERGRVATLTAALDDVKAKMAEQRKELMSAREAADGETSLLAQSDLDLQRSNLQEWEAGLQRREAAARKVEAEAAVKMEEAGARLREATAKLQEVGPSAPAAPPAAAAAAAAPSASSVAGGAGAEGGVQEKQNQQEQQGGPGGDAAGVSAEKDVALGVLQERLKQQDLTVARLKHTREKLLLEMDELSSSVERLFAENEALSDALLHQRNLSSKWELQAQEGLSRAEQLKNMLEESAQWTMNSALQGGEGWEAEAAKREADLLAERAKVADLDLQVRALSAELTKASQHTGELGRSVLPVLTAIEARMTQMALNAAS